MSLQNIDHGIVKQRGRASAGPIFRQEVKKSSKDRCWFCEFRNECKERVGMGVWVKCERPDVADIQRLQNLDSQKIIAGLFTMKYLSSLKAKIGKIKSLERIIRMIDAVCKRGDQYGES